MKPTCDKWWQNNSKAVLVQTGQHVDNFLVDSNHCCGGLAPSMSFNPKSDDKITSLEEQTRLIKRYQQSDSFLCGYPVVDADAILYRYRNKVQELLDVSDLDSKEQDKYLLRALRILIGIVHLVPASRHHHHRTMGGLFEHSVECAIFAAKEIQCSRIFRRTSIDSTTIPQNRWILGAILCGLFHDVGKALVDVHISTADRRIKYVPTTQNLLDWAVKEVGVGNAYFAVWKSKPFEHEKVLPLIQRTFNVVDGDTYLWLGEAVAKEVRSFFRNHKSVFKTFIGKADHKSIEYSMKRGQFLRSTEKPFDHDRVNFIEAFKRLLFYGNHYQEEGEAKEIVDESGIRIRGWTINTPESAVLLSEGWMYVVFDQLKQVRIAYEIDSVATNLFDFNKKTSELSSIDLETELEKLVHYLVEKGCLSRCNNSPYWQVQRTNPKTGQPYGQVLKAVRLSPIAKSLVFNYQKKLIPGTRPYYMGLAP